MIDQDLLEEMIRDQAARRVFAGTPSWKMVSDAAEANQGCWWPERGSRRAPPAA
jgi:hypothetical protein